jgi:hypothetical protein
MAAVQCAEGDVERYMLRFVWPPFALELCIELLCFHT